MRLKRYLAEKYWGRVESMWTGMSPEIFVNPTKKEFLEVSEKWKGKNFVRFIADPRTKEIYIWTPNNVHVDIVPKIYNKSYASIITNVFSGVAVGIGNQWTVSRADEINSYPDKYKWVYDTDWSWADKYIKISQWISLNEKYAFSKRAYGNYIEVFVNPSPSEIKELLDNSRSREIRFSAWDNTKKVYIWDADLAIHHEIEKEIEPGGEDAWQTTDYLLSGNARKQGNKLVCDRTDQLDYLLRNYYDNLEDILNRNWNWLKKYININTIIKRYKRGLEFYKRELEEFIKQKGETK